MASPLTAKAVAQDAEAEGEAFSKPGGAPAAAGSELSAVSLNSAATFLSLGCAAGTLGESITDMATALAIRKSLTDGRQDLALANQAAVFFSMLLAYVSETRPVASGGRAALRRSLWFILAWGVCQFFRGAAVHILSSGAVGASLLFGFVFLDKYTGPLGAAALDVALLEVLRRGAVAPGRPAVRGTLLWTARMAVSRVERPLCQLVLLHTEGFPIQLISGAFTAVTCLGVLAVAWPGLSAAEATDKKEQ